MLRILAILEYTDKPKGSGRKIYFQINFFPLNMLCTFSTSYAALLHIQEHFQKFVENGIKKEVFWCKNFWHLCSFFTITFYLCVCVLSIWKAERDLPFTSIHSQRPAIARAGCGESWEPRTLSGPSMWVAGIQVRELTCLFPECMLAGSWHQKQR